MTVSLLADFFHFLPQINSTNKSTINKYNSTGTGGIEDHYSTVLSTDYHGNSGNYYLCHGMEINLRVLRRNNEHRPITTSFLPRLHHITGDLKEMLKQIEIGGLDSIDKNSIGHRKELTDVLNEIQGTDPYGDAGDFEPKIKTIDSSDSFLASFHDSLSDVLKKIVKGTGRIQGGTAKVLSTSEKDHHKSSSLDIGDYYKLKSGKHRSSLATSEAAEKMKEERKTELDIATIAEEMNQAADVVRRLEDKLRYCYEFLELLSNKPNGGGGTNFAELMTKVLAGLEKVIQESQSYSHGLKGSKEFLEKQIENGKSLVKNSFINTLTLNVGGRYAGGDKTSNTSGLNNTHPQSISGAFLQSAGASDGHGVRAKAWQMLTPEENEYLFERLFDMAQCTIIVRDPATTHHAELDPKELPYGASQEAMVGNNADVAPSSSQSGKHVPPVESQQTSDSTENNTKQIINPIPQSGAIQTLTATAYYWMLNGHKKDVNAAYGAMLKNLEEEEQEIHNASLSELTSNQDDATKKIKQKFKIERIKYLLDLIGNASDADMGGGSFDEIESGKYMVPILEGNNTQSEQSRTTYDLFKKTFEGMLSAQSSSSINNTTVSSNPDETPSPPQPPKVQPVYPNGMPETVPQLMDKLVRLRCPLRSELFRDSKIALPLRAPQSGGNEHSVRPWTFQDAVAIGMQRVKQVLTSGRIKFNPPPAENTTKETNTTDTINTTQDHGWTHEFDKTRAVPVPSTFSEEILKRQICPKNGACTKTCCDPVGHVERLSNCKTFSDCLEKLLKHQTNLDQIIRRAGSEVQTSQPTEATNLGTNPKATVNL